MLPVLLVIVLGAVDFGRLFYAWVTVNNAARVGANYAAINPNATFGPGSTYDSLVRNEGLNSMTVVCPLSGGVGAPVPTPTFQNGVINSTSSTKDLGDKATVGISCDFRVITPGIASIVGGTVKISASSTFTIRTGAYQP